MPNIANPARIVIKETEKTLNTLVSNLKQETIAGKKKKKKQSPKVLRTHYKCRSPIVKTTENY